MVNRFSHLHKNKDGKVIEHLTSTEKKRIAKLAVVCIILIIGAFCAAYFTSAKRDGIDETNIATKFGKEFACVIRKSLYFSKCVSLLFP